MNPHIFRAYDIRGIAQASREPLKNVVSSRNCSNKHVFQRFPNKHPEIDLTEEIIKLIGKGTGTYLQKHYGSNIVVGRDNRLTSETLQKAFIEGLLETGCNVTDIGLSTSPLIYYAVCKYDFNGGINITASHNPKEYNGLKIVGAKGHSICGDEIQNILVIIQKKQFTNGKGALTEKIIFDDYVEDMKRLMHPLKPLKIVIDAGNGTAGAFAPKLFRAFGHEVIELYCELDGNFPNHEANPEEYENMKDLIETVKKHHADIGIGFDGDGDRIGMIDETGNFYAADYMLLLLSRDLLKRNKGAKIVYDLKSSLILAEEITKHGGIPIMAKTGHSFIEQEMKQKKALLGGEVSGHMFFAENYYGFDDAFLAGLKLAEILSRSKKPLSRHFEGLHKTCITPEIKVPCADDKKFTIVDKITDRFKRTHKCITIDGVRIEFDDSAWGIVRSSNTSPCLTLRFEAKTPEKLREIQEVVYNELKKYPDVDLCGAAKRLRESRPRART